MLLLTLVLLARQAPTMTVAFPPTRMPEAMALLSKASGRHLTAVKALGDEVVLARLKDASVDVALGHLADSLCAKWESLPDGTSRLTPDPAALRRLNASEAAVYEKKLMAGLNYLRKCLGQQPKEMDAKAIQAFRDKKTAEDSQQQTEGNHGGQLSNNDKQMPVWRATAQMALLFDPKALLAMPQGDREVFTPNPTAMQHPLPDGASDVVERYKRESSLYRPNMHLVARVKVVIKQNDDYLSAMFMAIDAAGNSIGRATIPLLDRDAAMNPSTQAGFTPTATEEAMPVPEDAREARIALSNAPAPEDVEHAKLLAQWAPRFLDPVKFEPTHWHAGQDMVLAAAGAGKNLIGTVSDEIDAGMWVGGGLNLSGPKAIPSLVLNEYSGDFLPTSDGWLVSRPHARLSRGSREQAKGILQLSQRQSGLSVDSASAWAAESTDKQPFSDWFGDYLASLFPPSVETWDDVTSLRLWASLGPGFQDALRHGRTLRLSTLPQEAQTLIFQLVFWYSRLDDSAKDPTYKMPDGITDGSVSMSVWESPVFQAWSSKSSRPIAPNSFSPELAGWSLTKNEAAFRANDQFRMGVKRTYSLAFVLDPGQQPMTIELTEVLFDPDATTLLQLPDDVAALVEQARQDTLAQASQGDNDHVIPVSRGKRIPPPQ